MINNFQKNAQTAEDRDTGSLGLIVPLAAGDRVWVEWRGYGDSFLYSNPYRLIRWDKIQKCLLTASTMCSSFSFSGFMLRRAREQ